MKRLIVLSFLSTAVSFSAQSIGNSPYASFGIGDVKYNNSVDVGAMGGISTAHIWDFNNNFNFSNPAANTNLELTSIKVQGTNENNFFKTDYNNMNVTKHSSYLSGISIAFPISRKLKFGFGYQPYSSKKYQILTTSAVTDGTKANLFTGEGTLNTIQAAFGYTVTPEFNLGLRTNYYFGKLYDTEEVYYSTAELINGYETINRIKSFNFTLGSTYQKKLKNDRKVTFGATYTFGTTGNFETNYTNSTYYVANGEKVNQNIIEEKYSKDKNIIPQEISLGVGYGHDTKWFTSAQINYKKGSTVQYLGQPFTYQDSYRFSAGGWILPNYNNFRNYLSRVIYRGGLFYEKGSLKINNKDINSFGVSVGASLPFEKTNINRMSGIDFGIEVGKRGTVQNNLINQNFINLKIGFNFSDKWFQKRVYQ